MTRGEFKSILLPCYRQMYDIAFAILRDSDDASDAVQDLMADLWLKHERLEIPDNPQAFCIRSARNFCIDRLRADSKRYFDNIDSLYMMASDFRADTEVSLRTTLSCIAAILSGFKMKQRRILILSLFSQLSTDEICVVTGESPDNVRVILSRGRKRIKQFLSDEK